MSILIVIANILAISVLVDWITILIIKKNINFMSTILIAICIFYFYCMFTTGGILR